MDLEHLIELILPPIIGVLEMMGIFVVAVSAVRAFAEYLGNTFLHRHYALQFELADGLATGLEPLWMRFSALQHCGTSDAIFRTMIRRMRAQTASNC